MTYDKENLMTDDQTQQFGGRPEPEPYRSPTAYGQYQPPQRPDTGPQPLSPQYAPPQTPQPYQTQAQPQQHPQQPKGPTKPSPATVGDGFDLPGLFKESAVVAICLGIVLGVFAWVLDLATDKIAEASDHAYTLDSVTGYVVYGVAGAVLYALAVGVLLLLYTQVNNPNQVYGWLGLIIPLVALAVLLSVDSWWQSVPLAIMVVAAAAPTWGVVPVRVRAYYDEQRAVQRAAERAV